MGSKGHGVKCSISTDALSWTRSHVSGFIAAKEKERKEERERERKIDRQTDRHYREHISSSSSSLENCISAPNQKKCFASVCTKSKRCGYI